MAGPLYCKTSLRDRGGGTGVKQKPRQKEKEETHEEPYLLCCQCLHPITPKSARIAVNGAHMHTFANPHGIVFDIGCFQSAEGCAPVGAATDEFTWFAGYMWRIVLCRACLIHMGWMFTAADGEGRFFGLIPDHLLESGQ